MKAVAKIIDMIFKAVEWVITALVALMSALVLLQIINRAILNTSLTWSEEIVNYSMIWIAMLGSCLLVRNNGHMAVDNFLKMLRGVPKSYRHIRFRRITGGLYCSDVLGNPGVPPNCSSAVFSSPAFGHGNDLFDFPDQRRLDATWLD